MMVYGESLAEHKKGKKFRVFKLGKDKIPDTTEYDHVGVKDCLFNNYMPRTEDRMSKGMRVFHSIMGAGIRKKALNMMACSAMYWSIIIPIVTYGSEVWVLKGDEIESLCKFQRYVGRKCQRYPSRSPNYSSYAPLGWISIEKVVYAKKLMFLRTILMMEEDMTCKRLVIQRARDYTENLQKAKQNE